MCSIAGFYNSNRIFNTEHERYSYILNDMNKAKYSAVIALWNGTHKTFHT